MNRLYPDQEPAQILVPTSRVRASLLRSRRAASLCTSSQRPARSLRHSASSLTTFSCASRLASREPASVTLWCSKRFLASASRTRASLLD